MSKYVQAAASLGAVVVAASSLLVCGTLKPTPPPSTAAREDLLAYEVSSSQGLLVFPPARDDRWIASQALPDSASGRSQDEVRVLDPSLDASGRFQFDGQSLRLTFDDSFQERPTQAKFLRITPPMPGAVRWTSDHTLEFDATRPFDPDQVYTVELSGMTASSGRKLTGFKAEFTATPIVFVAGKVLSYLPKPGHPRVISVFPESDDQVGRHPRLAALYDQPVSLAVAGRKVKLVDADRGVTLPVGLGHPAGPTFDGVKVDPSFVVLATPLVSLKPGETLEFSALDQDGDGSKSSKLNVTGALALSGVACGPSYERPAGDVCEVDGAHVRTSGRHVEIAFNNRLHDDNRAVASHVRVTPPVRNLSVTTENWDGGRVVVQGDFDSSKTYVVAIDGLGDRYGNALSSPVSVTIETTPLAAGLTMPEGLVVLDDTTGHRFQLTSRNVTGVELLAWPVSTDDREAFKEALRKSRTHDVPDDPPPIRFDVSVDARRDANVTTDVDLAAKLPAGGSYLLSVRPSKLAFDAPPMKFPEGSEAARPPVALVTAGGPGALAADAHVVGDVTLVEVARLATGEPVGGATVRLGTASVDTDASGLALLRARPDPEDDVLDVRASDARLLLPLGRDGLRTKELFPDLASGTDAPLSDHRAFVMTDRGVYRPGSTVHVKTSVRKPEGDRLVPLERAPVRVRVLGPTNEELYSELVTTDAMGGADANFVVPPDAKLGRQLVRVEDADRGEPPLATTVAQVAEFEAPRFAVDVAAADARGKLRATVHGRYLFGAPMGGASVHWTLRRDAAPMPGGPFTDGGLAFRPQRSSWFEIEDDTPEEAWTRTGDGVLAPDGALALDLPLSLTRTRGPQTFTLEADVTDSSYRHIANRASLTEHPAARYAGLRLPASWVSPDDGLSPELGVIDHRGQPVLGAAVTARLVRVDWTHSERRAPGGGLDVEWAPRRVEVSRCTATSGATPVPCGLRVPGEGDYEVVAAVDGRDGGEASVWAWRDGGTSKAPVRSNGRVIPIVPDKPRYMPGDHARLLVRSPFPAANAVLTVEQGSLLDSRVVRIQGAASVVDVPLTASNAPYVHATVTLLPIGAKGERVADYRVGAVRLPVSIDGVHLDVAVRSDHPSYRPGDEAEIAVDVHDGKAPEPHAEIALAVVDEGILRLTGFHAPDPSVALRPGRSLAFELFDSRTGLGEWFLKSHVAGDGGGSAGGSELGTISSTRKDFVETALWLPSLRTDANGHATTRFKLPDNLTEFRVMAVALDDEGKAASSEASFTVTKPILLVPAVPRFALLGDHFEAAAMLHNNGDAPAKVTVTMGDQQANATVPAGSHARVAFPVVAENPGEMKLDFAVKEGEAALDRVEARVRVDEPGYPEHPDLSGAFRRSQTIALAIPQDASRGEGETLHVQVGERLWPELGARLEYLLEYPHGCVEQTTSSTLPLLAARTILPRIGFVRLTPDELRNRIEAGLERLRTMRTESGGLAYWPGGTEPNVFGTGYAMRAVVLAKETGVEPPKGLLEGMQGYLADQLLARGLAPEVQAAIAQSLAETKALPASAADALYDTREAQSVFGLASLAIALHELGGQDDRVATLLDMLEKNFDANAELLSTPRSNDFYYYGSPARSRAQAAIALSRLRRGSKVLPLLLRDLARATGGYTTQATAWSLLALAEQLRNDVAAGKPVGVSLDGEKLVSFKDLGFGSREYTIPVSRLAGKAATLRLDSEGEQAAAFSLSARYTRRGAAAADHAGQHTPRGPEVYRVYTDAKGAPVDLSKVHAGDVVRVAVMVRLPRESFVDRTRRGFVAITDRLPAGFEPIQPDLATVARVPDISNAHPFGYLLRDGEGQASHAELHDDRVNLYFDQTWGDELAASYLARASTPGHFDLPPALGELMYEPDSEGFSAEGSVVIQ